MKRLVIGLLGIICTVGVFGQERELIWPKGKMPDAQEQQIAAMTNETSNPKFKAEKHRTAYLEWFDAPDESVRNGTCMILISGGGYFTCCDVGLIDLWHKELTKVGVQ